MIELTVNFVFKFLHIFGLMLGAASGFGAMIVARRIRRSGGASPELAALRPLFGRLGMAGIVLLWLSGLLLWMFRYDFADLGPAFSLKMMVSLILLGVVLAMNAIFRRAQAAGTPPPPWLPKLGMTTPVLMLTAMGLGVWIFI